MTPLSGQPPVRRRACRPARHRTIRPTRRAGAAPAHPHHQRGVALAISLVLLVAMTVIGVATLSGTRLNEKISSNAQQKSVAFEVAESAIDTVWSREAIIDSIASIPAGSFDAPDPVTSDATDEELSGSFNQTYDGKSSIEITGSVSIQYCGESPLPEGSSLSADASEVRMVGTLFDVGGVAEIEGSGTRSEHVQRGSLTRPATGRRGKCTVPGMR